MNKPSKKLEKPNLKTKSKPKTETELQMKKLNTKTRSPLSDLNRETSTTSCFRFLKSNSNSSNSNFLHGRSKKTIPNSAPPKNPPKQKNQPVKKKTNQSFSVLTPEKEKSGFTPPIQASISPEITCGSSVAATPVCFAAGHVITGVTDKRKCRPRAMLTIANENKIHYAEDFDRSIAYSSSPPFPPLINGASVQWLSSPSNFTSGDSVPKTCSMKCQNESESPLESTSSFRSNSGPFVQKTPTSNSSTSPFSVILKRASKSSRLKEVHLERETMCFTEIFESMDLCKNSENGASFEFWNNFRPLNSVDLTKFRNPNPSPNLISPESDKRISWREGLASRIFEMGQTGQMDCCKWLSDDEFETEEDPFEVVNMKISRDQNAKCEFAESIYLKGEHELVSSDDSDWRFLYQNQLFDI